MLNSETFFTDCLKFLEWEQSYVTIDGERVIDRSQRSSKICKNKFSMNFPEELKIFAKMSKIKRPPTLEYTLYKYEKGDFFATHVDRERSPTHAYTLLLLPPCDPNTENYFNGGDLRIGKTTIKCNKLKDYTYLVFSIHEEHELLPILYGERYVFKTHLELEDVNADTIDFVFERPTFKKFLITKIDLHDEFSDVDKQNEKYPLKNKTNLLRDGTPVSNIRISIQLPDINNNPTYEQHDSKDKIGDPNFNLPEDYDAGYYLQPAYRKGIYLQNKINKRVGKPNVMD